MNPATIASLTTAGGTLILAIATFSSTRSANRAARIAERSLLASLRPVLVHAQLGDPMQKIGFADDHWVHVEGPSAVFEVTLALRATQRWQRDGDPAVLVPDPVPGP